MTNNTINGVPRELLEKVIEDAEYGAGIALEYTSKLRALLTAQPQASAEQSAPAGERETIRAVFLRNGFTIKEGQTDLKPYVYAAAEELLSIARASWQRTQSAPGSEVERVPLESLEFVKRPVPSGWAVKRSDASRHELYGFYDEYLGPLDGWLQDPRRAVLFGNKEAAIAAQAALSVGSKLAISVVWLVYDPVFDTYREQLA